MMTSLMRLLLELGEKWRVFRSRRGRLKDNTWSNRRRVARWEARHRR